MDAKDSFLSISMTVGEECVRRRRCGVGASSVMTFWTISVEEKEVVNVEALWRGLRLKRKFENV